MIIIDILFLFTIFFTVNNFCIKLYIRHDKINYLDVQLFKLIGIVCRYFMRLSVKRCDALFYSYYSRSIVDADAEKIKNLLAHCQYSGSSKIIHEAYNGDFRVRLMIIFVIGMRAVLAVDKVAVGSE